MFTRFSVDDMPFTKKKKKIIQLRVHRNRNFKLKWMVNMNFWINTFFGGWIFSDVSIRFIYRQKKKKRANKSKQVFRWPNSENGLNSNFVL